MSELKRLRELQGRTLSRAVDETDRVFLTPEGARWCRLTNNAIRVFDRILARAGIP